MKAVWFLVEPPLSAYKSSVRAKHASPSRHNGPMSSDVDEHFLFCVGSIRKSILCVKRHSTSYVVGVIRCLKLRTRTKKGAEGKTVTEGFDFTRRRKSQGNVGHHLACNLKAITHNPLILQEIEGEPITLTTVRRGELSGHMG